MNTIVTVCLTIVAVVALVCATILYVNGHDGGALVAVVTACVAGVTGYTVGRSSSSSSS